MQTRSQKLPFFLSSSSSSEFRPLLQLLFRSNLSWDNRSREKVMGELRNNLYIQLLDGIEWQLQQQRRHAGDSNSCLHSACTRYFSTPFLFLFSPRVALLISAILPYIILCEVAAQTTHRYLCYTCLGSIGGSRGSHNYVRWVIKVMRRREISTPRSQAPMVV